MCLLAVAFGMSPQYPLMLAANRDERHARPSLPAHWWADQPDTFGGRDLEANGTWLAVDRRGRLAAVTNFREVPKSAALESRGRLVADFLSERVRAPAFASDLGPRKDRYGPFNLLLFDGTSLVYCSNRAADSVLAPGIHVITNSVLDADWPKIGIARSGVRDLLASAEPVDALFSLLATRGSVPREPRYESDLFIEGPIYGTRSSTVVLIDAHGVLSFAEQCFGPDAAPLGERRERFEVVPAGLAAEVAATAEP